MHTLKKKLALKHMNFLLTWQKLKNSTNELKTKKIKSDMGILKKITNLKS